MGLGFSHPTIRDCLLITLPRIMYPLPRQPVQGRLRARTGALRCLLTFANPRVQAGGTEGRSVAGRETGAGETGVGDLRNEGRRGSGWAPGADEWDLMGLGRAVTIKVEQKAGRPWGRGAGDSRGSGNPHLMLILVPYSDFRGCLCLEVCLHLRTRE